VTVKKTAARNVLESVSNWVLQQPTFVSGSVRVKPDGSYVTDADMQLHSHISELIAAQLPTCTIISEEAQVPYPLPNKGWVAVLDPLDGTENFIDGRMEWSVCLSLWCDGTHAGSALVLPSIGARLISGDLLPRYTSNTYVLSAAMVGKALPAKFRGARVTGSAGWNFYHVIRGSFCGFVSPPNLRSWDIQAGICLAVEAGCAVRLNGVPYDMALLDSAQRYSVEILRNA
jgi:myo-inositol-1(or 4)-monophosphatase